MLRPKGLMSGTVDMDIDAVLASHRVPGYTIDTMLSQEDRLAHPDTAAYICERDNVTLIGNIEMILNCRMAALPHIAFVGNLPLYKTIFLTHTTDQYRNMSYIIVAETNNEDILKFLISPEQGGLVNVKSLLTALIDYARYSMFCMYIYGISKYELMRHMPEDMWIRAAERADCKFLDVLNLNSYISQVDYLSGLAMTDRHEMLKVSLSSLSTVNGLGVGFYFLMGAASKLVTDTFNNFLIKETNSDSITIQYFDMGVEYRQGNLMGHIYTLNTLTQIMQIAVSKVTALNRVASIYNAADSNVSLNAMLSNIPPTADLRLQPELQHAVHKYPYYIFKPPLPSPFTPIFGTPFHSPPFQPYSHGSLLHSVGRFINPPPVIHPYVQPPTVSSSND